MKRFVSNYRYSDDFSMPRPLVRATAARISRRTDCLLLCIINGKYWSKTEPAVMRKVIIFRHKHGSSDIRLLSDVMAATRKQSRACQYICSNNAKWPPLIFRKHRSFEAVICPVLCSPDCTRP